MNETLDQLGFGLWRYVELLQSLIGAYLKREGFCQEREIGFEKLLHDRIVFRQPAEGSWGS